MHIAPPQVVNYAELGPMRVVAETVITHRELGIEQTEAAIDHFLELSRRRSEARRRLESTKRFQDEGGSFARSHAANEEKNGWERWIPVIENALKNAEDEIVSAVRAWEESRRPADGTANTVSGVIYKGHLYLTLPTGEGDARRLVVADLKASLNLDRSLAVVDLIG